MDPVRLAGILHDLEDDRRRGAAIGERLCDACVDVLEVAGAGIMLMSQGEHCGTLGASDAVISTVEELQFTTGEGPCIDASMTTTPVFEPDLDRPGEVRWPAFTGPAVEAGVAAIFGFPLRAGTGSVGALDLYLSRPGPLDAAQVGDALVMAEVITLTVLALQADAPPGALAPQLGSGLRYRAVTHQAAGMLSVQLGVDVDTALVRLRAHAYTSNRPVNEVAHDIVARRLRLDDGGGEPR